MPNIRNFRKHLIILGLAALCFFAAYGIINQNRPSPITSADHAWCDIEGNDCSCVTCNATQLQAQIDNVQAGESHTFLIGDANNPSFDLVIDEGETIDCGTNKDITLEIYSMIDMNNGADSTQVASLKNCTIKKSTTGIQENSSNLNATRGLLIETNKNSLIENNDIYTATNDSLWNSPFINAHNYQSHIEVKSSSGDHTNVKIKNNNFYLLDYTEFSERIDYAIYINSDADNAPDTNTEDNMIIIDGNTVSGLAIEKGFIRSTSNTHHKINNNTISVMTIQTYAHQVQTMVFNAMDVA